MFYRDHDRVTKDCGSVMITKQSHKDECDIQRILRQFQRTGIITHVQSARPSYEDLPDSVDFQQALHVLDEARDAFAGLPSVVRDYFANDPGRFLAAFQDDSQRAKLEEFGLVRKRAPAPPAPPEGEEPAK